MSAPDPNWPPLPNIEAALAGKLGCRSRQGCSVAAGPLEWHRPAPFSGDECVLRDGVDNLKTELKAALLTAGA